MKTNRILLMGLCGVLAASSPLLPAGQTANNQPADAANTKTGSAYNRPKLSWGLDDIAKLSKAGVDESVILAYIKTSNVGYHPTAQDVIQLREIGVSAQVITALMHQGSEVRTAATVEARKQAQAAPAQPTYVQPAPVYAAPTYVAPASTVTYIGYPRYSYDYYAPTYYSYPSYSHYYPRHYGYYGGFYPRVSFGFRFGGGHFGGFHGGFRGGFRHCR